jgi:hypothetical protein
MLSANPHLAIERLAALDHEPATNDELVHLSGCTVCRGERQAFQSLRGMASAMAAPLAPHAPRLTEWEQLATVLRREGMLPSSPMVVEPVHAPSDMIPVSTRPTATRASLPGWMRVAAALALTAGGALFGRLSTGAPLLADDYGVTARPAVASAGDDFASVQQASDVLYRAQRDYERASLWLAANDSTVHDSDVYRARLAALDQMMAASRAALRDAPQDPVLNHYFLAAYTAREATLQALGGTLPVDKSLERY